MVVIDQEAYGRICNYIHEFVGLSIDCEQELKQHFVDVDPITVSAIHAKEWQKRVKNSYVSIVRIGKVLAKE